MSKYVWRYKTYISIVRCPNTEPFFNIYSIAQNLSTILCSISLKNVIELNTYRKKKVPPPHHIGGARGGGQKRLVVTKFQPKMCPKGEFPYKSLINQKVVDQFLKS